MPLSDTQIRALKPAAKAFKVADEKGLYLQIAPSGGKLWRMKYRIHGKEKKLALGAYPAVSLAEARKRRDEARAHIAEGQDPGQIKQRDKVAAQISAANTFEAVAEEFIERKMVGDGKAQATLVKARYFLELLRPHIGNRPISEITPSELLIPLRKLEAKGTYEAAKRCRTFASRIFRYAVMTDRCISDPASPLRGALVNKAVKHHAAILDPKRVGELLRAIDGYEGSIATRTAMQIAPHVFVRPGELRHAEWSEFDFAKSVWRIPAEKMKMGRPHAVPLSAQVKAILEAYGAITGKEGYVFPSLRTKTRPMSENTVNAAFRRMGFSKEELTGHGLRTTASSLNR
jgi:integrase